MKFLCWTGIHRWRVLVALPQPLTWMTWEECVWCHKVTRTIDGVRFEV